MNKLLLVLGLIVVLIVGYFLVSNKGEKQAEITETVKEIPAIQRIDLSNAQYTFDFEGVDAIMVQYEDFSTGSRTPLDEREIRDPKVVARVAAILKELPREGDLVLETVPGLLTDVVAFKDGEPFAYVTFHRTLLKNEDGNFYGEVEAKIGQLESELYSIVAELR